MVLAMIILVLEVTSPLHYFILPGYQLS